MNYLLLPEASGQVHENHACPKLQEPVLEALISQQKICLPTPPHHLYASFYFLGICQNEQSPYLLFFLYQEEKPYAQIRDLSRISSELHCYTYLLLHL